MSSARLKFVCIFILLSLRCFDAPASQCTTLSFVAVKPAGHSPVTRCDRSRDRQDCQVKAGYAHFGRVITPDGLEALRVVRAAPTLSQQLDYLHPLDKSPMLQELNQLRILARQISRGVQPCEPNYIYVGSSQIFGMGPAFVSSKRFMLDGKVTTNLIVAEDASAPFHIPMALLSKKGLARNHYYETVIAHELAHGLMQDLYGVDAFGKLEGSIVSRDGHFASAITDPALAWIEGFAEGFEAYLGEKYLSVEQQATPHMDKLMAEVLSRMKVYERHGWDSYALTIPGTIATTARTMLNMDDFVADFLKAERQQAVRENHYVVRGAAANLGHRYGLPIGGSTLEADIDEVIDWAVEPDDAVYSKEGIVAHFVYRLLKAGLAEEVFMTLAAVRPRDVWEFATLFRAGLAPEKLASVAEGYRTVFTEAGRKATRDRLRALHENEPAINTTELASIERRYDDALARVDVGALLPTPKDMWVEFWNSSYWRLKFYGYLDRLNLSTATPGRIHAFLKNVGVPKGELSRTLKSFLSLRERHQKVSGAIELARSWKKENPENSVIAEAAAAIAGTRRCFNERCLSGERE